MRKIPIVVVVRTSQTKTVGKSILNKLYILWVNIFLCPAIKITSNKTSKYNFLLLIYLCVYSLDCSLLFLILIINFLRTHFKRCI